MDDRGAGEGPPEGPVLMPSPFGGGRGRGRARGSQQQVASPDGQVLPVPGMTGNVQAPSSPNAVFPGGDAPSPGRPIEGGLPRLRKPKQETTERLLGGPGGDAPPMPPQQALFTNNNIQEPSLSSQVPVTKSSSELNVNAPEFVSKSTLRVTAKEFVPRSYSNPQAPPSQIPAALQATESGGRLASWDSVPSTLTTPSFNAAVDLVKQAVFQLTIAPGNLQDFMVPLVEELNGIPMDLITVIDIVNVILEQAVMESNFTYTGARMCDWLVRHFRPQSGGEPIKFLGILMKRCQVEQENSLKLASENPSRLQGFALFMAELLQNVKIVTPRGDERIEILGKKLKELVMILLQHPVDSNLKCVVRILKCTGAVLEDMERAHTGQAAEMDGLITQCMALTMLPTVSKSIQAMLKSVADLRTTNWGRFGMESVPVAVQAPRAPSPFTQSDPIFYNVQGQVITRDAAGFAEENPDFSYSEGFQDTSWSSQEPQFNANTSFDNGLYVDNEIDDEIADAFEQFLIDTQQA